MNNENTKKERYVNTVFILVLGILIGAMITIPTATYIANRKSARLVSELEQKVAKLEKGPGDTVQQDTGPGDTGPQEEELDNSPQKVVEDTNKEPDTSSNGQQGGGMMKMNMTNTNTSSSKPQPNLIKVLKDTNLYSRPDEASKVVGKVKKGENLTFLKEADEGWLECKKGNDKIYIYYYFTNYQNPGKEEVMPRTSAKVYKETWLREKPGLSGKRKKKIKKNTEVELLSSVDVVKDAGDHWYLIKILDRDKRKKKEIGYVHNSSLDIAMEVYSDDKERIEYAEILVAENSFQKGPDETSTSEPATATVSPNVTENPTSAPATATASPQATANPTETPATATASPNVTENPTSAPATVTASSTENINPVSVPALVTVNSTENIYPVLSPTMVDVSLNKLMSSRGLLEKFATSTSTTSTPVTAGAITVVEENETPVTEETLTVEENEKEETAEEKERFNVTVVNATKLYKEADINSETIANLQAGDKVTDVTEVGKGWLKGTVNGSEGYFYYLNTDYCKVANKEESIKEEYDNKVAVITADGVNVRTAPSITAEVVDCVDAGTTFKAESLVLIMDGEKHGWCKITVNGIDLYVYSKYVKIKNKEDDSRQKENDATKIPQRTSNKNEADRKEETTETRKRQEIDQKKATTRKKKYEFTGKQFRRIGVIQRNGWKYTWYSSKKRYHYMTPKWHLDENGVYRDKDEYVVVACTSVKKGSKVPTIFGTGKVYDNGCAKDKIDIYTNYKS